MVAQAFRDFPAGALAERSQFRATRRAEGIKIRGQPEGQGDQRADELQAFDETAGLQLGDELRKKAESQLVDQKIGGEKSASLRLGHSLSCFLNGRAHPRFAHRIRQLLPERRVAGQGDFPNFPRGDALREKAEFFGQGETRRVFTLHETSRHFFEQRGGGFLRTLGQTLAREFENDAVKTVRHDQWTATLASRTALSFAQSGEEFLRRLPIRFGPSPTLIDAAFVIGSAGEGFLPRFIPERFKFSPGGKALDISRRQSRQGELGRVSKQRIAQAIDRLEVTEKQDEPFPMLDRKTLVHRPERMRHGMRDVLGFEVTRELVDVATYTLDLHMLFLGDTPREKVHFDVILRKESGDFLADEGTRLIGDFQTALDRVVVGEGDKIKSFVPQRPVDCFRLRAARRKIHLAQQPVRGARTVTRMKMEIGAGHGFPSLDGTRLYFTSGFTGTFRTHQAQKPTRTSDAIPARSPKRSG